MIMNSSNYLLKGWLSFALVIGLVSCANDPYYAGPPPHTFHAHYHPHDYYYYPSVRVYFNYTTGYYYYPSGHHWKRTKVLPPEFRLDQRDRIIIRTGNDKPYIRHSDHRNQYRPHPEYRADKMRDRAERRHPETVYKKYKNKQK